MRTRQDGMRERLREIEAELIELAAGSRVPDEQAYAQALLAEARRIERNVTGDVPRQ
jgi:hypothetical protein